VACTGEKTTSTARRAPEFERRLTVKYNHTPEKSRNPPNTDERDASPYSSANQDGTELRPTTDGPFLLARVAQNKGDLPGAIECLDRVRQFASDNLAALIEKGALLHRAGKTGSWVECFRAACRIAPEDELALTNLAVAPGGSGHRHEAVVEFRGILQLYPENLHARHQLRRLTSLIVPFLPIRRQNDARRNEAFEGAIRAVQEKGRSSRPRSRYWCW
jgi:hypothetical protein